MADLTRLFGALLIVLLGIGTLMSQRAFAAPVGCNILVEHVPAGVRLSGRAMSSQGVTGHYTFLANKEGPSGTSRLLQDDDFALVAGVDAQLGDIFIGIQARHNSAHMTSLALFSLATTTSP